MVCSVLRAAVNHVRGEYSYSYRCADARIDHGREKGEESGKDDKEFIASREHRSRPFGESAPVTLIIRLKRITDRAIRHVAA